MNNLEEEIHKLAGTKFNVASPKQAGDVIFNSLGIEGGKKTPGGDWSTTAEILEKLASQGYEIATKMLEWRQISKLKSTYTDTLATKISPRTGRLHSSYSMAGTATGRLSSSEPNLQNIPIRSEEGLKIRSAFIAEPGWKILSVDYSQIELRLAACMADIKALREAFARGVDIHAWTAAKVFGLDNEDKVSAEERRKAKAVNFGIIYGISKWGLARQLNVSPDEAGEFLDRYLQRFPELSVFMENCREEARTHGFVRTLYGRKCFIRGINDRNHAKRTAAERQAINAPLQGTAADIMKIAMRRVYDRLLNGNYRTKMLIQVHDELVFEVPEDELEAVTNMVTKAMETIPGCDIPLIVSAGHGDNWSVAH